MLLLACSMLRCCRCGAAAAAVGTAAAVAAAAVTAAAVAVTAIAAAAVTVAVVAAAVPAAAGSMPRARAGVQAGAWVHGRMHTHACAGTLACACGVCWQVRFLLSLGARCMPRGRPLSLLTARCWYCCCCHNRCRRLLPATMQSLLPAARCVPQMGICAGMCADGLARAWYCVHMCARCAWAGAPFIAHAAMHNHDHANHVQLYAHARAYGGHVRVPPRQRWEPSATAASQKLLRTSSSRPNPVVQSCYRRLTQAAPFFRHSNRFGGAPFYGPCETAQGHPCLLVVH